MRRRRSKGLVLAVALLGVLIASRRALAVSLDDARKELHEQRYLEARAMLDTLLLTGNHSRGVLVEIYELRGEVESVVGGPDEGEREFRKLLMLDPNALPPPNSTPVLEIPYQRAKAWARTHGALAVECRTGDAQPVALLANVRTDPLQMVTRVRAFSRVGGLGYEKLVEPFHLPATARSVPLEYYVEFLDSANDVVAACGSAERPRTLEPAPAPSNGASLTMAAPVTRSPRRWRDATLGVGISSALVLGAAIGLNVAAQREYDSLQTSCGPRCTQGQLHTLHVEKDTAITGYVVAGVGAVVTGALLLHHYLRTAH